MNRFRILALASMLCIAFSMSAIVLTKDALGSVKVGGRVSQVPSAMPGLYERHEFQMEECAGAGCLVGFYNNEVSAMIYTDGVPGRAVTGISVYNPERVTVKIKRREYRGDITAHELLSLGGKAYYVYWDGIAIYIDGITFYFDINALTPEGYKKINTDNLDPEGMRLNKKDFQKIGRPFLISIGDVPKC